MGVGGQWHNPAALTPGKRPVSHCIEGWVSPRTGLDGCGEFRSHRDWIAGPSSQFRVAIATGLSRPAVRIENKGKLTNIKVTEIQTIGT